MNKKIHNLKNSTVAVTGGAGFIGSHIVDLLLQKGASKIIVIDNLSRGIKSNLSNAEITGKVKFIEGDILDNNLLRKLFKGVDYIFHEAVIRVTLGQDYPRLAHDVIATGTFNVLEAAKMRGVKRTLVTSSTTVYGEPKSIPISEEHPYGAHSFYSAAKIYSEALARTYTLNGGLDCVIVRPFNVYGERMDIISKYQEVIPIWFSDAMKGRRPQVHGKGDELYDFTYVKDVAKASLLALEYGNSSYAYNVGTGKGTTLLTLAKKIIELSGHQVQPEIVDPRNRVRVKNRLADINLTRSHLNFKAEVDLDQGLKNFYTWYSKIN